MAQDYSFFIMDKGDGRIESGTPISLADKYDAREGALTYYPKHTDTGSQRYNWRPKGLSCRCAPKPGVNATGGRGTFFISVVTGSAGKLLILRYFNALEVDWVYETALDGNFGYQL